MIAVVVIAVLAVVALAPQWWVKRQMKAHSDERADFPGTGAELARHLVERFELPVQVEMTDRGDHYDPDERMVRLSPDTFHGRSLTAVAVAAHEIGHAIQHARDERGLRLRQGLAKFAQVTDKFASIFFLASPVLGLLFRTPAAFLVFAGLGICFLAIRVVVHLVTLPVEYDASFGKALPILEDGYVAPEDADAARSVLKAAAFTYVAAACMSLVDLARWIRILR